MNISLITLNTKGRVDFEETLKDGDFEKFNRDQIKKIDNLVVKGYIIDNGTDSYELNLDIIGDITIKSARNNSDVLQKINVNFHDFILNLVEIYKKTSNSLDILPIIWENILLEIPIRAVNTDDEFEVKCGSGWEIINEED